MTFVIQTSGNMSLLFPPDLPGKMWLWIFLDPRRDSIMSLIRKFRGSVLSLMVSIRHFLGK